LTRAAGPDQAITAEVELTHYGAAAGTLPVQVRMLVGRRPLGEVTLGVGSATGKLSAAQTSALLAAVLGKTDRQLSGNGANAVLLKMDEFQRRIGTPGAVVRKGSNLEASVLPAPPRPIILAAPVPDAGKDAERLLTPSESKALLAELATTPATSACEQFREVLNGEEQLGIYRRSADELLVGACCWRASWCPHKKAAGSAIAGAWPSGPGMAEPSSRAPPGAPAGAG